MPFHYVFLNVFPHYLFILLFPVTIFLPESGEGVKQRTDLNVSSESFQSKSPVTLSPLSSHVFSFWLFIDVLGGDVTLRFVQSDVLLFY